MSGRNAERLVIAVLGAMLLVGGGLPLSAAEASSSEHENLNAQERAVCINNLKAIYEAIQAYQVDHKDLPNWLSDLVPKYLPDANVLVCPVCRRTGRTEGPPLADPVNPSSYLFEFCPVPLGAEAPKAPNRTRREWKRRQMGLVGSAVPIVRCRHHDPVLNLSFDGRIYDSPPVWELVFTNRLSAAQLTPAKMFEDEPSSGDRDSIRSSSGKRYAPRDPKTRNQLLDLSPFYNAMLTEAWHGNAGNDLAALPVGVQTFAGIDFDVRGIVQLYSKSMASTNWPMEVKAIPVLQKCRRLHFLHSAGHGKNSDDGKQIGAYIIHYAANRMRLEVPIVYGRDVRDWHNQANEPEGGKELTVAWRGENAVSKRANSSIRLFLTTWTNLVPAVEIESIDFVSSNESAEPFLIAITAD